MVLLFLSLVSLVIWIVLVAFWGGFWRCDRQFEDSEFKSQSPSLARAKQSVCAVVPARNEAEVLPVSLRSLLQQTYPLTVILVDDRSTDGTATVAQEVAKSLGVEIVLPDHSSSSIPKVSEEDRTQLHILSSQPLPAGWTGKLWALEQGTRYTLTFNPPPDYLLLTDADIDRAPGNLQRLVTKAQAEDLDLVSLMVLLRCQSFWEKLLVPAFVFFFQKLYPFPWVNNPQKSTAAAAGGCILIKREALERIGGLECIKNALIDDCALAKAVKFSGLNSTSKIHPPNPPNPGGNKGSEEIYPGGNKEREGTPKSDPRHPPTSKSKIWLGLTRSTHSLRPYDTLGTIWEMVTRTAFTQLNYSPLLLLGTLIGMTLIYIVPPVGAIWGSGVGNWPVAIAGFLTWGLMSIAYFPTVRFYNCSPLYAFCLPIIAFLYSLMTLDSAVRHWQGRGGSWKGRVY
jgi:hopene-associated glycosyltransferase HpnB